jgi:hypothetical protein
MAHVTRTIEMIKLSCLPAAVDRPNGPRLMRILFALYFAQMLVGLAAGFAAPWLLIAWAS